jgi:hypothetical protein
MTCISITIHPILTICISTKSSYFPLFTCVLKVQNRHFTILGRVWQSHSNFYITGLSLLYSIVQEEDEIADMFILEQVRCGISGGTMSFRYEEESIDRPVLCPRNGGRHIDIVLDGWHCG